MDPLEGVKAELAKTASESRVLGSTTFIKEAIREFPTLDDDPFQLLFDFKTDKYYISPSGGAIAVAHNRSKNSSNYCTALNVYDSNCNQISCFPLTHDSQIKQLYVSPEECIIVAYVDCHIESYNLDGKKIAEVSKYDGLEVGLKFYAFWSSGVILCTDLNKIYIMDDFVTLKPRIFCNFSGPSNLKNGTVIPPDPMTGIGFQLWCTMENKMVALIQGESDYEYSEFPYPAEQILFSPNKKIALVQCYQDPDSEYPQIYCFCKPDLSAISLITRFENTEFIPEKIAWCGSDAILLARDLDIALIGATSDAIKWTLQSECAVGTEIDGARIFTRKGSYLLRAITKPVFQFSIWNKKSPQVRLFQVISDEEQMAKSDITINPNDDARTEGKEFTVPQLQNALDGIIEAALFFNSSIVRTTLMKMASRIMISIRAPEDDESYVKERLERIHNYTAFADKLTTLRSVEQLKSEPYNIPITYAQYVDLNSVILLKRLCNRRLYREAFKLSQYLGIDDSYIKSHWATNLIMTSSLKETIVEKIKSMAGGIDYVDMAKTAFNNGRNDLGLLLLEENKAKSRAVPLLLERGEWEDALNAALNSYDTSLIMFTFETLENANQKKIIEDCLWTSKLCRDSWILYKKDDTEEVQRILKFEKRDGFYDIKRKIETKQPTVNIKGRVERLAEFLIESNINFPMITEFFTRMDSEVKELIGEFRDTEGFDKLTPNEVFEQAILTNDRNTFITVGNDIYFGLKTEEIFWRRLQCGIKYDSVAILTQVKKAVKKNKHNFKDALTAYVNEHGSERAKRIFNDEDGENMKIPDDDPIYKGLAIKEDKKKKNKDSDDKDKDKDSSDDKDKDNAEAENHEEAEQPAEETHDAAEPAPEAAEPAPEQAEAESPESE